MHSHGDDLNSSGGESDGLDRNGGGGGQGEAGGGGDMDSKRRRRLELNRKVCAAGSMTQLEASINTPLVPLPECTPRQLPSTSTLSKTTPLRRQVHSAIYQ